MAYCDSLRFMTPKFEPLLILTKRLDEKSIPFALGGSALLRYYSCDFPIHDWDITTDVDKDLVESALTGLEYVYVEPQGGFASSFLFKVGIDGTPIDLIGSFALHHEDELFHVPTKVSGYWKGIPIGDPVSWARAYEIMGRNGKAQALRHSIK